MRGLTTPQYIVIGSCSLLLVLLLSFGRTVPFVKKGAEGSEGADTLAYNDEALLAGARQGLDSAQLSFLAELEQRKAQAKNLDEEVLNLKLISRTWNEFGNFAVGAYYAQKVAELNPSGEHWGIAGTSYAIAFNKEEQNPALRKFLGHKSIEALKKATEMEPNVLQYRINEAMMYVDLSMVDPKVPPMTGAQKLLALDEEHPNNVSINLQLGRLSRDRSGDFGKAVKRFENIIAIADTAEVDQGTLMEAHYSSANAYQQLNQPDRVLYHLDQCIELAGTDTLVVKQMQLKKEAFMANRK